VAAAAELFGEYGGVERGACPDADPCLGMVVLVAIEEKSDAVPDQAAGDFDDVFRIGLGSPGILEILPGERDGGDLIVFGDGQRAESASFKFHRDAAKRTVEFVVDEGGADAVTQQVRSAAQCGGRGLVVGETSGVGDDGNPQRFCGNLVEFPTGLAGEAPDHFPGGGGSAFDPVQGAEERVGAVVVDVDDRHFFSQGLDGLRQTVERAAIQGDQQVEFLFPRLFRREEFLDTRQEPGAAEAAAFGGGDGFDARAVEQVRQGDHGSERVTVRTDVSGDQDALRAGDGFDQRFKFVGLGFGCVLHTCLVNGSVRCR